MKVFRGFHHPGLNAACALTIGNFDGVHRGHQAMLALLNNEFTVKRFYRRGGVVKLLAENSIYPPRLIKAEDDFTVWGVVTYNLHKLY